MQSLNSLRERAHWTSEKYPKTFKGFIAWSKKISFKNKCPVMECILGAEGIEVFSVESWLLEENS
jgi:hypothetical protein